MKSHPVVLLLTLKGSSLLALNSQSSQSYV